MITFLHDCLAIALCLFILASYNYNQPLVGSFELHAHSEIILYATLNLICSLAVSTSALAFRQVLFAQEEPVCLSSCDDGE